MKKFKYFLKSKYLTYQVKGKTVRRFDPRNKKEKIKKEGRLNELEKYNNGGLLNFKITNKKAKDIINKVLKLIPIKYTKDILVDVNIKENPIVHNAGYDRLTKQLIIQDKDLFYERTNLETVQKMRKDKKIKNLIGESNNDYNLHLSGKKFYGLQNIINTIFHEVGHHIYNNEKLKKDFPKFDKKINTNTTIAYNEYFEQKQQNEKSKIYEQLFQRKEKSENFAENFRIYAIKKYGKNFK